jgi:hypothetical protein
MCTATRKFRGTVISHIQILLLLASCLGFENHNQVTIQMKLLLVFITTYDLCLKIYV